MCTLFPAWARPHALTNKTILGIVLFTITENNSSSNKKKNINRSSFSPLIGRILKLTNGSSLTMTMSHSLKMFLSISMTETLKRTFYTSQPTKEPPATTRTLTKETALLSTSSKKNKKSRKSTPAIIWTNRQENGLK